MKKNLPHKRMLSIINKKSSNLQNLKEGSSSSNITKGDTSTTSLQKEAIETWTKKHLM